MRAIAVLFFLLFLAACSQGGFDYDYCPDRDGGIGGTGQCQEDVAG